MSILIPKSLFEKSEHKGASHLEGNQSERLLPPSKNKSGIRKSGKGLRDHRKEH